MAVIEGTIGADMIAPGGASAGVTGGVPGNGDDTINGNAGNDTLDGGGGANSIQGGDGNDLIYLGYGGEVLSGGAGSDTLYYTRTPGASIDLGVLLGADGYQGSATLPGGAIDTLTGFENAYGGTGDDTIKGSHGANTLSGDVGNDLIDGRTGFDTLDYGTAVNAAITGGVFVNLTAGSQSSGGVTLAAGTARDPWGGTDTILGIEGVLGTAFADTVIGSNLDNLFSGGNGADSLNGSGGQDTLIGGSGSDTLRGGDGNDSILGGSGGDVIMGGYGSDAVDGGEPTQRNATDYRSGNGYYGGAITLVLAGGVDATVNKGGGADGTDLLHNVNLVYGSGSADSFDLSAQPHNAPLSFILRGGAGDDTIIGNGTDRVTADYNAATSAVVADLASGVVADGSGGTDHLVDVRAIISSAAYDDSLTGSAGDDTFIVAGTGSKTINGGDGLDTWRYQGSTASLYVDLGTDSTGGAYQGYAAHSGATDTLVSIERAFGGAASDTIKGSNGDNTLGGDAGNDSIDGRAGFDVVDYSVWALTPITTGVTVNLGTGSATDGWGGTDTLTNIEGAIGTDFADTLLGSNLANRLAGGIGADSLSGGGGDDTLQGGAGNDILRGGDGNDLLVGGAGTDTATFLVASTEATWLHDAAGGWTVTSAEGTDRLAGIEVLRFTDRSVTIGQSSTPGDLNGDGTSDILWRHADGTLSAWTMQGAAGGGARIANVGAEWSVAGQADFDGDGRADILWHGTDGTVAIWQMNGGTYVDGGSLATVGAAWTIVGAGDLNGDGRADILWQHSDGTLAAWLMNGLGGIGGGVIGNPGSDWKVVGMADFDGDGRSDIVYRSDAGVVAIDLMDGTDIRAGREVAAPGTAWTIAGTGDFDGDGKADLLWRNGTDGSVSVWTMDGLTPTAGAAIAAPGTAWNVAAVGDYNADGMADILWRGADGSVSLWLMDGTIVLSATSLGNPGNDWAIV